MMTLSVPGLTKRTTKALVLLDEHEQEGDAAVATKLTPAVERAVLGNQSWTLSSQTVALIHLKH